MRMLFLFCFTTYITRPQIQFPEEAELLYPYYKLLWWYVAILYRAIYIYSYTMGTNGLPDIYTRSPRAEGVYIRGTTSAHGITIM